jgi:hypothetical protein
VKPHRLQKSGFLQLSPSPTPHRALHNTVAVNLQPLPRLHVQQYNQLLPRVSLLVYKFMAGRNSQVDGHFAR